MNEIPASTEESDAFSRDLKRRGFSFVGTTTIYAHMQAVGMVNDHVVECFRHREIRRLGALNSLAPATRALLIASTSRRNASKRIGTRRGRTSARCNDPAGTARALTTGS